ncbi:MAG: class I SAM-dependent methyltransferase [Cyanobacteriota bacterium]
MNKLVKNFYNLNPYPPVKRFAKVSLSSNIFEQSCKIVNKPVPERPSILIAGCGTVAAKVISGLYPDAKIICAIDLSAKTIEIAKAFSGRSNKNNIYWVEGDISDKNIADKLPAEKFDWIHCTGVLHHLEEPEAGIRNLSSLLNNEGLIRFQVYSKGARVWIEWARKAFLQKEAKNYLDVKTILSNLPLNHPFRYILATYPESFNEAGLKDGFLHPVVNPYYASEWENILNKYSLGIRHIENLHYLNDKDYFIPDKAIMSFDKLDIISKITILEKLGEWRSDFKGIITKSKKEDNEILMNDLNKINQCSNISENKSYSRYYLWQQAKSGIKSLNVDFSQEEIKYILGNLFMREWLPEIQGLAMRFRWSVWNDKCRRLASSKIIFEENISELIEDYLTNTEDKIIPEPQNWPWIQFNEGVLSWSL